MILTKINKSVLVLFVLILTQCYTEPFFELTVSVVDEDLNPVSGAVIKIEVIDIENGSLVDGSIIDLESTSEADGKSLFSFENKAFITARVCYEMIIDDVEYLCKEGHVYLEDNVNKEITLMIQSDDCNYCM